MWYVTSSPLRSNLFCLGHAWRYGLFEGTTCMATVSPCLINGECRRLTCQDTLWRIFTKSWHQICVGENRASSILSELRMAGQVDLLMRNEDSTEYHILDYKFIKEPLERKSYYNRFTRKYKMMSGPFSRLMDTTTLITAYSLRYTGTWWAPLAGRWKQNDLWLLLKATSLFTRSRWRSVTTDGVLHAKYKHYKDKIYDSSKDPVYLENPYRLI
jgi:hypothetical protein